MNPINDTLVNALFETYLEVSDHNFMVLCWERTQGILSSEACLAIDAILALSED